MSWPSAPVPVRAGLTGADPSAGSACSLGRLGVLVASSVTTHHGRLCRPGNTGTGHTTNGSVGGLFWFARNSGYASATANGRPDACVRAPSAPSRSGNGWVQDKVEGLAVGGDGQLYAVTDNDGVDDATDEAVLLRLGSADAVLGGGTTGGNSAAAIELPPSNAVAGVFRGH